MDKLKLNRRQFFILSAASAGAVLLSPQQSGRTQISSDRQIAKSQVYSSTDGLLDFDLEASYRPVNLGGIRADLLAYNGQISGPRLEAKPGDTLRLRFTNNLTQPTNLHYHGLHVTPTGNGDNVFLEIPPGEALTYEFTIPSNHPAGTFWYHPHLHGLVAEQIFGGLAGLFIVRGELDEITEIKAAKEEFLFLKDFELDRNGQIVQPSPMARMTGREGSLVTVNGQIKPTFSIATGGLLRLRLVNASTSRFYRLELENHPLYLIATDGGSLSEPVEVRELLLSPGERAEVLVRGEREPGLYRLLNLPYDRGGMGMMGRGMMGRGMRGGSFTQRNPETLATFTYSDSIASLPLPQKLIPVEALPEPDTVRRFEINHGMTPGMGMVFLINGQTFSPNRIDTQVRLNSVEDWEFNNIGVMDHPLHIHVNNFQIISRNGRASPYRAWKDTVVVSPGETVRIRTRFADFTGKTVYHCHIFDHEDLGMMGIMEIT
ncbi:Bilirubin oxidase (plasmid) [Stanieria cyanosphaera PCC 7437]|uniref:Bilirubin oxidase n=1 Tax=Stanieria cyanosphaera (strain ATCC 29371 / PCC 7437) TaxID=111780 RepID=K9Y048_STAC7|nr:multicopper oxidase family protein [Stanieria cyanosphaera]AFZ38210.1 Bilirubin oxidase [Stanieria cyanosphaera PCC 7437]